MQRGCEYLKRLGFSLQHPRPRHRQADDAAQEEFKKNTLVERLAQLKQRYPRVSLWTFDEHRLGLKPILRRIWAAKGERPIAPVHHRYKWLYL